MMSSNSSSTDPADDFPEVDDYSEVDDLDAVAAELAAELRSGNGHTPEAPVEPVAAEGGDGVHGEAASPEQLAAALAEQVGIELNGDTPIAAGPVDLVEQGLTDDDDGHHAAARAGWFPPVAENGPHADRASVDRASNDGGQPVTDPIDGASDLAAPSGHQAGRDDGVGRQQPETFERPPSSPPIERAPLAPEPPAAAPTPRVERNETPTGRPVDQVAVRKLGGFNFLSISQWSTLPRDERARLLKGGLVMFLFEGEEVPVRPALLWLQQIARSEGGGPDDPPTRRRGR